MRRIGLLSLALICLIWLAGCGRTDDLIIAQVVSKKITGGDLREAATKLRTFEGTKSALLWILIDKELLVIEAQKRGVEINEEKLAELENTKKRLMERSLKEKIARRIRVPDSEIRDFYVRQGLDKKQEVRARHILVQTQEEAEEILKQLQQGADFAQLAKERSLDKPSAEKGGDLGYWEEGTIMGATAQKVFSMKAGERSEPFQSQGGFHIIEVLDRRLVGLEKQRKVIFNRIRQQKSAIEFEDYMNEIEDKINLHIDDQTLSFLRTTASGTEIPSLGEEDQNRILIRYDGGEITLGKYLQWISLFKPQRRPDLTDSARVVLFARRFDRDAILLPEALRRNKIETLKEIRSFVEKRRQQLEVDELRRLETEAKLITPQAIREYYESYPDLYFKPPRVRVETLLFNTLTEAKQAYREIKGGVALEEVGQKYPLFGGRYQNYAKFTFEVTEKEKMALGATVEVAAKAEVGELKGPYSLSFGRLGEGFSGYAIAHVLEKEPAGQYSLDDPEIERGIVDRLRTEKDKEIAEMFQELVTRLRAKYSQQTVVREDALKVLPELAEAAPKQL